MLDRPEASADGASRALLVELDLGEGRVDERLTELAALATSAGATIVGSVSGRRNRPDAAMFAGKGKVEEIGRLRAEHDAGLVIFDHPLSGAQQRNLENALQCRVIDRTSLILDIFAQRARSREGKLQVELAQLKHLSTRLVGGWTHLERQKGGIGLRGPGETQLETDRRLITQAGEEHLRAPAWRREDPRDAEPHAAPCRGADGRAGRVHERGQVDAVQPADRLARPTPRTSSSPRSTRRCAASTCPDAGTIVLSDTVGFIRELPHDLVAAFRATLSEAADADLLLHVIDAAAPDRDEQIAAVESVLEQIGAADVPQIRVFNKTDADRA